LSSVVPHFLHTRTFRSPRTSWPIRTGPQVEHTSCTLEIAIRLSCSAMPPLMLRCGFGRTCFFTIITCSTSSLASFGNTRSTRPSLPLSRPVITFTVSFRRRSTRLCSVLTVLISNLPLSRGEDVATSLQYFRRQGHNLQKLFFAQFAGYRPENAGSYRLALFIDQHRGVFIDADVSAVAAAILFVGPHDYRFDDSSLLHLAVGRRFFHAGSDHVSKT